MLGSGASFIELRRESEPGAGLRVSGRGATRLAPAASLEPSSIFSVKSLHDSGDSVARLGDDRQTGPDFLGAASEPEDDASSFAVGGKGLASAAGAANARKNLGLSVCHLPIERLIRPSRASSWR